MWIGSLDYWAGKKMSNRKGEEAGSFGYGFKVIQHADSQTEFQPTTIIKNVPMEFIIMQMQVFLDDIKKQYRDKHSKRSAKEE